MASGRVPRHEACGPRPERGVESRRRRSAACERIFFSNQKNIPSRFPRKIVRGDFDFPPDNPLETTKGRASALPLETILEFTGDFRETGAGTSLRAYGGRWDRGRRPGAGCLRSFGAPCLAGDEGDGGSVDLEPAWMTIPMTAQGKAPLCKGSCRRQATEGLSEVAGHFWG